MACGDVVERLQERDRLRREQLKASIAHMEHVASRTARELVGAERKIAEENHRQAQDELAASKAAAAAATERAARDANDAIRKLEANTRV